MHCKNEKKFINDKQHMAKCFFFNEISNMLLHVLRLYAGLSFYELTTNTVTVFPNFFFKLKMLLSAIYKTLSRRNLSPIFTHPNKLTTDDCQRIYWSTQQT